MDINVIFLEKANQIKTLNLDNISNEKKLKIYGLYKQATEGNCNINEPFSFRIKEHAKWNAWNENKNMSQDDAKKKYISEVESIIS